MSFEESPASSALNLESLSKLINNRKRIDDLDFEKLLGDYVMSFTGPPGTCFLTNNYGFHRGKAVECGERTIFQVLYSMAFFPKPKEKAGGFNFVRCNDTQAFFDRSHDDPRASYASRLICKS